MSDLVERLRGCTKEWALGLEAADTIEAQAWEIEQLKKDREDRLDALSDSRAINYKLSGKTEQLQDEVERLNRALHDIREEWAGAECGEPVTAQEAYAIGLAKRMYALAVEAMEKPA